MYQLKGIDTEYLSTTICAIYDGGRYYLGIAPSWEYPKEVYERQLAGEESGLMHDIFGTDSKGRKGTIYTISNEILTRDEIDYYAVMLALPKIVRKDLYKE